MTQCRRSFAYDAVRPFRAPECGGHSLRAVMAGQCGRSTGIVILRLACFVHHDANIQYFGDTRSGVNKNTRPPHEVDEMNNTGQCAWCRPGTGAITTRSRLMGLVIIISITGLLSSPPGNSRSYQLVFVSEPPSFLPRSRRVCICSAGFGSQRLLDTTALAVSLSLLFPGLIAGVYGVRPGVAVVGRVKGTGQRAASSFHREGVAVGS